MIVTIDGPAGCGKSTVAKQLARELGVTYLDSGAIYRTLAYAVLQEAHPPVADHERLAIMARALPIRFEPSPDGQRVMLGDREVTKEIRTERVTEIAAQISQVPAVRAAMVERQRQLANTHGVVVEGRDTGSVVFPHATHKFFLSASLEVRARRRQQELRKFYGSTSSLKLIREQIETRDRLDRTRKVGPLIKPARAIEIDTSGKTVAVVVRKLLRAIRARRRT